jgi:hypothetical protein
MVHPLMTASRLDTTQIDAHMARENAKKAMEA